MIKSKIKLKTMKSYTVFSLLFLFVTNVTNAQDVEQAKKAIDAEQFEKAKAILKTILLL